LLIDDAVPIFTLVDPFLPPLNVSPQLPSPSQRAAIEAAPLSLLVLAGPGAGKTFCLIERIRFLVEQHGFDPGRICAFTFTNKAAGEIASRLERQLGTRAEQVRRGTIHAFCAELLREFGDEVGVQPGFGIADEEYCLAVLRRIEGPRRWHRNTLTRFSANRFRGDRLMANDAELFDGYERFLGDRKLLDFDMLVLKAAELLERGASRATIRHRWDVILVDEFQDLNPVQYRIIRELARDHKHIFAVGDHDQSIYSWAGADPGVFRSFMNDFGLTTKVHLEENHRCPHGVFALAQRLVNINLPIFDDRVAALAPRQSAFAVVAHHFESDDAELAWIVDDIRRDRECNGHDWGDIALLYRQHAIGDGLEAGFLNAGIPCRLAQGRALAEDPIVGYVLAALRVILVGDDSVYRDAFFAAVLSRSLFDEARAQADAAQHDLRRQLNHMATRLPRADASARQIRRALYSWRNLEAIGRRHTSLSSLVQELLSQRVGRLRSVLEERHDELSDPASHPEVVRLAGRLRAGREREQDAWLPRLGGAEIPLRAILYELGFPRTHIGGEPPTRCVVIGPDDAPTLGIALCLFKAAQLIEVGDGDRAFRDFTAIDLETTDKDTSKAEIVEIAAARVRDGKVVETFAALVKPQGPIPGGATRVHGIRDADVATASRFAEVWPLFAQFCGSDVIIAHNGYEYDFRILQRVVRSLGKRFELCTYDTLPLARDLYPTSRKLIDLCRQFEVDAGRSHRALDDARALACVFVKLDEAKLCRARKTAMVNLLDQLGVALALADDASLCPEARLFRQITRGFALGRYSSCLESYERESLGDEAIPTVDEVIDRLGGVRLMEKIRSEKTAEERYPAAMLRLRRLIAEISDGPLERQIIAFLERAVLSKFDGDEPRRGRVNLLTLHSTKGLEFSRVYVIGAEDSQLPGGSPTNGPKPEEVEEARRLLYVGMTRTEDRLVLTYASARGGKPTGGHQFLDEMGLVLQVAANATEKSELAAD
jgi:superfamily I DNA/RNA helicase/inhibitor of KinA sporulation pathway (predicted exonuclease)